MLEQSWILHSEEHGEMWRWLIPQALQHGGLTWLTKKKTEMVLNCG